MRSAYLEENSGKFFQEKPTVESDTFDASGTTVDGVLASVSIPLGAYVTKVALVCSAAIGSQDLDVGDGSKADRYINAISAMTAADIITAPHVAGTRIAAGQVAGRYYAAADTIDVTSDITASLNDAVGSAKLMVWFFV